MTICHAVTNCHVYLHKQHGPVFSEALIKISSAFSEIHSRRASTCRDVPFCTGRGQRGDKNRNSNKIQRVPAALSFIFIPVAALSY